MKFFAFLFYFLCFQIFPLKMSAQDLWKSYEHLILNTRNYVVYQSAKPIVIDGKANEPAWEAAAWTDSFIDIEGSRKPKPTYQTKVKMLWDNNFLYILAQLEEPQIWAYYQQHDQIVYHENDFEVFIDPDGNTHDYFEFEINAANTLFDLFLTKPYRNGGLPLISWNAQGFKSAVSIDGTINNPNDVDKMWTVEMAIPFESLSLSVKFQIPSDGQIWKINFSRVEWQTNIFNGVYQKKKDEKTGNYLSEDNWVWNATGEVNMHVPERWGMLLFSTNPVNGNKVEFREPEEEELKKLLWLVYYKQQDFKRANKRYASSLSELSIPEVIDIKTDDFAKLKLSATTFQFSATITNNAGRLLMLNEDGLLQTIK